MNATTATFAGPLSHAPSLRIERIAAAALRAAAVSWFVVAAAGLTLFTGYVIAFYGGAALRGAPQEWNKVIANGWTPGDTAGNAVVAAHLCVAVLITFGGVLQLVPWIRRTFPRFHRWNGRAFMAATVIGSATGLYMIWTKTGGDVVQHVAISINAVLNIAFAALALKYALARRFDVHRRWALRLFLVVNGGWFFRVGLMLWIVANQGPVGFDPETFEGPFLRTLAFAQYVLPLALLELWFLASASPGAARTLVAAAALGTGALATFGGVAAAAALLWVPHF